MKDIVLTTGELIERSFALATRAHGDQTRGTSYDRNTAYIQHPEQVAALLRNTVENCPAELEAAAYVHDVPEDTDMELSDIGMELGSGVASIVSEVTTDPAIKGAARREFQRQSMATISINGQRLKVADSTINLINMAMDPPEHWTVLNKFHYLESRRAIIEAAQIEDEMLLEEAHKALRIAERTVFVAIRDYAKEKGFSRNKWRGVEPQLQDKLDAHLERAKLDLERIEKAFDPEDNTIQPANTLNEIYDRAPAVQTEISDFLSALADSYGFEAVDPGLKSHERASEVIDCRFDGDVTRISDIARGALICETMDDVNFVMHALSHSYKNMVIKNRFEEVPMSAYRDICATVRTDNSDFAEIQVHLRSFWEAKKERGDALYQQMREIQAAAQDRPLTREEKKAKSKLFDASRKLYKAAGVEHGFESTKPSQPKPIRYPTFLARLTDRIKERTAGLSQTDPVKPSP